MKYMFNAGWMAAMAPLGLIAAISIGDVLSATAMAPQGTCVADLTPTTPTLQPPTAPRNLRIVRGDDEFTLDEVNSEFGPNAGPESDIVAPAVVGSHPYFDQLIQRPDCLIAYSLRTQAQIDKYRNPQQVKVNYDAVMDAARWQWIKDDTTADNLRLPILLERPASGSRRILIVSDHRWDTSWFTEFKQPDGNWMGGWKWLQVTSAKSATNSDQRIWFEPQMRAIGEYAQENPSNPPVLSLFSAREYLDAIAPTTTEAAVGCGIDMGESVAINRQQGCFKSYANTWTRTWIEVVLNAGEDYAHVSWWMADENQNPVTIFKGAKLKMFSPLREFWYEYDTSRPERKGGPMAAWGRNVVVLKDVADPTPLLVRPTR